MQGFKRTCATNFERKARTKRRHAGRAADAAHATQVPVDVDRDTPRRSFRLCKTTRNRGIGGHWLGKLTQTTSCDFTSVAFPGWALSACARKMRESLQLGIPRRMKKNRPSEAIICASHNCPRLGPGSLARVQASARMRSCREEYRCSLRLSLIHI